MVERVQEALSERALQEVKEIFGTGMAAAASALSVMLDRKAAITVEEVRQGDLAVLSDPEVSGSLAFRIGEAAEPDACGVALFDRGDMQRVLGVLMGGEPADTEGMPFDEMNLSAACEVVSQMMDAAAGVLAGRAERQVVLTAFQGTEVDRFSDLAGLLTPGAQLVQVTCRQSVRDVLEGRFRCLLPAALARELTEEPAPAGPAAGPAVEPEPETPPAPAQPAAPERKQPELNVRRPQFPDFGERSEAVQAMSSVNASLLMGVPLDVSIVIGQTKRKIRDILEFGPGTVIDLDKQTGAPAEIIVNGQLLAYGDVIVIGDNYGVRVTEIVGTKELLDSLGER